MGPLFQYKDSLKQPYIQVNAQVRRLFQVEDDSGLGEWHEGSVYHINADFETHPFRSVKVAWLQQEVDTDKWLYSYMQTDCGKCTMFVSLLRVLISVLCRLFPLGPGVVGICVAGQDEASRCAQGSARW
jgi:hypothetical protein